VVETEAPAELPAELPAGNDDDEPVVEAPAPAVETPPVPADAAPGQVQVSMAFDGDCWTEITDARGERLFFGLGAEGRNVSVAGEAPLSVLFGNADNVRLRVDGAEFPIPAASRRGRTARFSIQAP